MALLFSAVTLTGDDNQVELLVPGIPKESNDLRGWTAYENFIASIDHTVYNCDDQITGISNYIPTNLPSACRVEPINLDIDYPGPNKVYMVFGSYQMLTMEERVPAVSPLYTKRVFSAKFTDGVNQLMTWVEKFGINNLHAMGTGEYEINVDYSADPSGPLLVNPLNLLIDDLLDQEENDATQHETSTGTV